MENDRRVKELVLKLHEVKGVKFGAFTLKYGMRTPIYVDLRVTVSYPSALDLSGELLWKALQLDNVHCDLLCGVPYGALPITTCYVMLHEEGVRIIDSISLLNVAQLCYLFLQCPQYELRECVSVKQNIPMVFRRKEVKGHGTRKLLEGQYKPGESCVIVEDVIVSGQSIIETAEALRHSGLVVTDAVVFLDREQGGRQILEKEGIKLHSVITVTQLLMILADDGKISSGMIEEVKQFLKENQCLQVIRNEVLTTKPKIQSFSDRALMTQQPAAKELFKIIHEKQSNLGFAADVSSCEEVLQLAEKVGPYICLMKIHVELLRDFTHGFVKKLQELSFLHKFLIYEDHKYSDIGSIVHRQYQQGFYGVVNWAHLTNAHPLPGPAVLNGLKMSGLPKQRGCFLIAEMSSSGHLMTQEYVDFALRLGELNDDFVIGFICQSKLTFNPRLINIISGVNLQGGKDNLGQHYLTPHEAVTKKGGDIIVVGRGISEARDPLEAARQYRDEAYKAYLSML